MHKYSTALVLGLGASGEAAARLLLAEGTGVMVVDSSDSPVLRERATRLASLGADVRLGIENPPAKTADVCIVSPGMPANSPWVNAVQKGGTPLLAELELGWSRLKCRVLAVTGSNGKSTLVRLCADSIAQAGARTAIAGNYEERLAGGRNGADAASGKRALTVSHVALKGPELDWLVLEVSSFQFETVSEFRPDVGVLLNVLPNHLDRHGDMMTYERMKLRMFSMMKEGDVGIVPDDWLARNGGSWKERGAGRFITFGASSSSVFRYGDGAVLQDGKLALSLGGTMFANPVLGLAAAAAAAAVSSCGLPCESVEVAARSFTPLPHRLQELEKHGDIRFVDDSKSTNMAALGAALKGTSGRVRLIAGGRHKGDDVSAVRGLLAEKASGVYLIGEAAELLFSAWRDIVPCAVCKTLERAVQAACAESRPGDTVLLSPGCLSWDQFSDFGERGDAFAGICAEHWRKRT